MHKTLTGAALAAALLTPQFANADFLSIYGGIEGWRVDPTGTFGDSQQTTATFNYNEETATGFYIGFEHPIPLIPNLKLRRDSVDTDGQTTLTGSFTLNGTTYTSGTTVSSDVSLTQTDVVVYWELLDLDLFSFDLGLNAKYIDTELTADDGTTIATDNFKGWVPMVYAATEISLPSLPLSLWAEGSYIGYSGDSFSDTRIAIKYNLVETLPMDLSLSLGYRALKIEVDDLDDVFADIDFSGYYAGIELRF
ncbi:MAG: TIGR04219 family outer membrane beta-barrel protein [Halopseudomonas sp.]